MNDIFGSDIFNSDGLFGDTENHGFGGGQGGGFLDGIFGSITGGGLVTGFLQNILGDFDLFGNVSNVFQYGLSSWGATTTPEGIGVHLNEYQRYIQNLIQSMTEDNLEAPLNELERFTQWGIQFYTRMRSNHAKATSTKKAYDLAKDFFNKQISSVVRPLQSEFKSKGIIRTQKSVSKKANHYLHLGKPVDQGDPSINYIEFFIDEMKVRELVTSNTAISDDINIGKSTAGMGIFGYLLIGFIGLKLFKKF